MSSSPSGTLGKRRIGETFIGNSDEPDNDESDRKRIIQVQNGNPKTRSFALKKAPLSKLCNIVIASYGGNVNRIAVINAELVYCCGARNFYWNEDKLREGIALFDLTTDVDDLRGHFSQVLS